MKTTISFDDLRAWVDLQRNTVLDFVSEAKPEELPASFTTDLAHFEALNEFLDAVEEGNFGGQAELMASRTVELKL